MVKVRKYIAVIIALLIVSVTAASVPVNAADNTENAFTQSAGESTQSTVSDTEGVNTEPTSSETTENTEPTSAEPATEVTEPTTEPTTVPAVIPDKIEKIIVGKITDASLTVKWRASKNATEYNVYRAVEQADNKLGKYNLYKTVTDCVLNETGLKQATKYSYKVYACRVSGGYSTQSDCVSISALTKPKAVSAFKVTKKTTDAVKMVWSKNSRASKYAIYRSAEKKDGTYSAYKLYKTLGKAKKEFTDKKLDAGRIYKYKIVVLRIKGALTSQSKGAALKTITHLNAVTDLKSPKQTTSAIKLTWSKVKRADKYQVYRGKKLIKTVKKTAFTDKNLKNGKNYKYSVRAIRMYKGTAKKGVFSKITVPTKVAIYSVAQGLSGTWVEVSISKQMMYMFSNGKVVVSTPVVTGNWGALSTTKGYHRVISRKSPARLRGSYNGSSWDTTVNYWLGFTGDGQGIHDATWRGAFGGTIYQGNGSHGCVNTPLGAMRTIYSKAYIGMPVIVY